MNLESSFEVFDFSSNSPPKAVRSSEDEYETFQFEESDESIQQVIQFFILQAGP